MNKIFGKMDWPFWASIPLLVVLPFLVPYTAIATNILIMAIFAVGYNLLLGYTGLMSFGHGGFYGLAAYTAGFFLVSGAPTWVAISGGVIAAAIGGGIIGYLSLRRSDVYFSLLTLAFSQVLYFVALQLRKYTGGDDGLLGIPVPYLPFSIDLSKPLNMYYLALLFFMACSYVCRRLLNAPFGKAIQAIRENEDRAIACGYHTQSIKFTCFIISTVFAGVAGSLFTIHIRFVPIQVLHWSMNGEVVFVSIVGGLGTFFGPLVGSATFILLHDTLQVIFKRWELVVGAILILFILFFKSGIVGAVEKQIALYRQKRTAKLRNGTVLGGNST